jgi:hypothetical protein
MRPAADAIADGRHEQQIGSARSRHLEPVEQPRFVAARLAADTHDEHVIELESLCAMDRHERHRAGQRGIFGIELRQQVRQIRLASPLPQFLLAVELREEAASMRKLRDRTGGLTAQGQPGALDQVSARLELAVHPCRQQDTERAYQPELSVGRNARHAAAQAVQDAAVARRRRNRREIRQREADERRAQDRQPRDAIQR